MARPGPRRTAAPFPRLSIIELLDVSRIQWRFERVCRRVPVAEPWTSPIADILDSKTLDQWLRYVHASASTRDLMAIMARVTWGCEPDEVSMLHAVRYVKAAGGLGRMLDVEGGAQQDRFPGGTQQIALRMADELGERVGAERGRAQHRAARRRHPRPSARMRGDVAAKAVIVADPARASGRDRRSIPRCPRIRKARAALAAGQSEQGVRRLRDAVLARRTAARGEALSDEGPVFITFDVSPSDDGPGHPAGLHRCAHVRPAARPSSAASARWTGSPTLFGDAAPESDRLRRSLLGRRGIRARRADRRGPAGSWTTYGPWLRKPVDGIFWAGTETADEWTGFLDGAVRSGQRAADRGAPDYLAG